MTNKIPTKVYIDIGNQLIKIGYQDSHQQWIIHRFKTAIGSTKDFDEIFDHIKIGSVYLGSVVGEVTIFLIEYFKQKKITYTLIRNEWFVDELAFQSPINLKEVGTDILGFAYYIKDCENALAINFGTATVSIHYDKAILGVTIAIDFFNSYKYLLNIIKLTTDMELFDNFGNNTQDAINGGRYFLVNGFINQIITENPQIKRIIYTGGNRRVMQLYKNVHNLEMIEVDEAVLKGYKLIADKKSI